MRESNVQKLIMCGLSENGVTTFRNNVGAYKDARGNFIRYGVGDKGGSDLICATTMTITPDMVGKQVAVFTAVEVKTAKGRIRPEQITFIDLIKRLGGIAGIARSEEDAAGLIEDYKRQMSE